MSAFKLLTPDNQSPASPASCLRPWLAGCDAHFAFHRHPHGGPIAYADSVAHADPVANADGYPNPSAEVDHNLA
jgi:hypothetical protein